nr:hypothetical protein [uncultured Hyphomonas sp.]
MEIAHRMLAAICTKPGCDQAIHISIGRYTGGVNDRGGFVIQCDKCQHRSYIAVLNPDDASSVARGGRVVATWDEGIQDRGAFLKAQGLTGTDELSETMLVIPPERLDGPPFVLNECTIYQCLNCGGDLERAAYDNLGNALDAINDALVTHNIHLLKGHFRVPETIEVKLDASCACGTREVKFYRAFSETKPVAEGPTEFILVGPDDPAILTNIDGVYSRDECVEIFKKLLLRWRFRHQVVLLVVPFIGLDFPGREENRVDLWNIVLGHTDPSRTLLVTRRGTYNGFLKAAKTQGIDVEELGKFNLLTPMLKELGAKGALFKQESHAKFYAAVGRQTTEVLSGSFNIHTGKYVENLLFMTYDTSAFIERYLAPLGVIFNPELLKVEREVLSLEIKDNKVRVVTN